MWAYFNREIRKEINSEILRAYEDYEDYILHELIKLERPPHISKGFKCPFDEYNTFRVEKAVTHLMTHHPELWNRIEPRLFKSYGGCNMVAQSPEEYTEDDFFFEALLRAEKDPHSIFSDEKFVIKIFEGLEKRINSD